MLNKNLKNIYFTNAVIMSSDNKSVNFHEFLLGAIYYIDNNPGSHKYAEDLMQRVSEKMWASIPHCYDSSQSSPKTYGCQVARRCHIDFWKKENHSGDPLSQHVWTNKDGDEFFSPEVEGKLKDYHNPETMFAAKESLRQSWECAKKKSEVDLTILRMTSVGYSPKEIADELNTTSNAVSMRLFKIRKTLATKNAA